MDLDNILKPIAERVEKDQRHWSILLKDIEETEGAMLLFRKITRDQLITVCADFIALYKQLGGD